LENQQRPITYRGIQLADSVKLYKKDGSYADKIKRSLDKLADQLENNGHKLIGEYQGNTLKILIDFQCGHKPHWTTPSKYKQAKGCPKCAGTCTEQAKENFYALLKENGHEALSIYTNNRTKVLVEFNCGHKPHWIQPQHYIRGVGCPKCRGDNLSEKFTSRGREVFQLLVKSNGHELLSEYVDSKTKVLIDFNCGHDSHWIKPPDYKNGHGCMECGRDRTNLSAQIKSDNSKFEFEKLIRENGHEWVGGEYKGGHEKVLIDFKCGHVPSWTSPSNYKSGRRCRRCAGTSMEQAQEDLLILVEENDHELLSDYIDSTSAILIDFKCGHKPNWIIANNYKMGFGCNRCSRKNSEQAEEELIDLVNENNHTLLSKYQTSMTKVLIDFNCGHEPHWITPSDYKNGYGCPVCKESKGERIIREYLEKQGITFKQEYKFPDSRKRYDFMLPFENTIIEVHGLQHYDDATFYNKRGRRTLKQIQEIDRIKKEYAESLGYNYIVVDYREHKPQLALERFIEFFNKLKAELIK
jgi:very-short-patch-repair endonuclease